MACSTCAADSLLELSLPSVFIYAGKGAPPPIQLSTRESSVSVQNNPFRCIGMVVSFTFLLTPPPPPLSFARASCDHTLSEVHNKQIILRVYHTRVPVRASRVLRRFVCVLAAIEAPRGPWSIYYEVCTCVISSFEVVCFRFPACPMNQP